MYIILGFQRLDNTRVTLGIVSLLLS